MTDTVSLCIPRSLIRKAKRHGINCSFEARKAIADIVKMREQEKAAGEAAKQTPGNRTTTTTDNGDECLAK